MNVLSMFKVYGLTRTQSVAFPEEYDYGRDVGSTLSTSIPFK